MASLQSHTMRVSVLRVALPALAAVLLAGVMIVPALREFDINRRSRDSATRMKVEEIAVSLPKDGKPMQLTVTKPEFTGQDNKGRPYMVTAQRVIQDGLTPGASAMNLELPVATLTLDDFSKKEIRVTAATGLYEPTAKTLQLNGPVKIAHSDGFVLNLQDLFIDLIAGISRSDHPVSGDGPGGQLSGEKLELRDKGNTIILHGKSRVVLTPKESE